MPSRGLISQLGYAYNKANQRTLQTEDDGTVTTWTYDRKYQLLNEDRAGGPAGTSFNVTHTYDPAGNRLVQNDGTTITTYTYTPANRLTLADANGTITTYTNDAAGNRTSMLLPTSDNTYYAWDATGKMVTAEPPAGTVTLTYNADGQRTAKQSTDSSVMGFLYDYKKLLHETDDVGGEITNTYATTSDGEFGDLISEDGEQYFHQFDAQASTNAMLNPSGTVEAKYKYFAYGQIASVSIEGDAWATLSVDQWAALTVDQWASLPLDIQTAMNYVGQKQYYLDLETQFFLLGTGSNPGIYYDANTIRRLSDDPIRQASGDVNLQIYVGNNPINKIDPSGHQSADTDARAKQQQSQTLPSHILPGTYLIPSFVISPGSLDKRTRLLQNPSMDHHRMPLPDLQFAHKLPIGPTAPTGEPPHHNANGVGGQPPIPPGGGGQGNAQGSSHPTNHGPDYITWWAPGAANVVAHAMQAQAEKRKATPPVHTPPVREKPAHKDPDHGSDSTGAAHRAHHDNHFAWWGGAAANIIAHSMNAHSAKPNAAPPTPTHGSTGTGRPAPVPPGHGTILWPGLPPLREEKDPNQARIDFEDREIAERSEEEQSKWRKKHEKIDADADAAEKAREAQQKINDENLQRELKKTREEGDAKLAALHAKWAAEEAKFAADAAARKKAIDDEVARQTLEYHERDNTWLAKHEPEKYAQRMRELEASIRADEEQRRKAQAERTHELQVEQLAASQAKMADDAKWGGFKGWAKTWVEGTTIELLNTGIGTVAGTVKSLAVLDAAGGGGTVDLRVLSKTDREIAAAMYPNDPQAEQKLIAFHVANNGGDPIFRTEFAKEYEATKKESGALNAVLGNLPLAGGLYQSGYNLNSAAYGILLHPMQAFDDVRRATKAYGLAEGLNEGIHGTTITGDRANAVQLTTDASSLIGAAADLGAGVIKRAGISELPSNAAARDSATITKEAAQTPKPSEGAPMPKPGDPEPPKAAVAPPKTPELPVIRTDAPRRMKFGPEDEAGSGSATPPRRTPGTDGATAGTHPGDKGLVTVNGHGTLTGSAGDPIVNRPTQVSGRPVGAPPLKNEPALAGAPAGGGTATATADQPPRPPAEKRGDAANSDEVHGTPAPSTSVTPTAPKTAQPGSPADPPAPAEPATPKTPAPAKAAGQPDAGPAAETPKSAAPTAEGTGNSGDTAQPYIEFNKSHSTSIPKPKGVGPNGGRLQSHHGLQEAWARANLKHYKPGSAPTVTLETGAEIPGVRDDLPHTIISNRQNARQAAREAAGKGSWSSTLDEELRNTATDFKAAGFNKATITRVLQQQYDMLDKLGVTYTRVAGY